MTIILFIDGQATKLLTQLQGKAKKDGTPGNTYFAPSRQATRFGVKVSGSALPNGKNTVFSVGVDADSAVTIPLVQDADNSNKLRGQVEIEYAGTPMVASIVLNSDPKFGGDYNIKPLVARPQGAQALDVADVFA